MTTQGAQPVLAHLRRPSRADEDWISGSLIAFRRGQRWRGRQHSDNGGMAGRQMGWKEIAFDQRVLLPFCSISNRFSA
jgi:hypothetical protein